jgi:hypothetical protein
MRFTLKTLFATVSVSALICCIFFALPGWLSLSILGLLWFLAPPVLIAGIVYGRGYGRAFSIGCVSAGGCLPLVYFYGIALVANGWDWINSADDNSVLSMKIAVALFSVLMGLCGSAAMVVRWLSLRLNRSASAPEPSSPKEYSLLHGRVATIQMESTSVEPEPQESASPS